MSGRLSSLLATLRPRTIARTVKSVESLAAVSRDFGSRLKRLSERGDATDARTSALEQQVRGLQQAFQQLQAREARLTAIYRRDVELEPALESLPALLDAAGIGAQVERSVAAATLHPEPFPHLVLDSLLPEAFYDAVIRAIPPVEAFDGTDNKQRIVVPFDVAPVFSRRVWSFLLHTVVDGVLGPALIRKFQPPLGEWLGATWPGIGQDLTTPAIRLQSTDGRILLRRRGYVIPPHRDPKWGFVTCLMYLARPGDSAAWGTQLYEVDEDREADNIAPHWIRSEQCRLVKDIPFRPNSALVFMNSHGAHGATIPTDAEPADLERYIYQFRIGPTGESIRRLLDRLTPAERARWQGKAVDYV